MAVPPRLPHHFTYTIEALSDWHIGSGMGRPGDTDRLVSRDEDELPFVRAKSVTGLWRDACERVALGLDDGASDGPWGRWVITLFGAEAVEAALSVRSARLAEALRAHLRPLPTGTAAAADRARLRAAVTMVKPGVAIGRATGRAKQDHLQFEEVARAGLVLRGEAALAPWLMDQPAAAEAASALLLAGAAMLEAMGGKRRRGAGQCRMSVTGFEQLQSWLPWLEAHAPEVINPPVRGEPIRQPRAQHVAPSEEDDGWIVVPFSVDLVTPVVVPAATVGNVVESLDFVPGTMLLAHIARRLNALCDTALAIAAGDLIVLPATLEVDGARGLPVPMAIFAHKEGGGFDQRLAVATVVNRLVEQAPRDAAGREIQLKPLRTGYIQPTTPGVLPRQEQRISMLLTTHNVIEDAKQRPTQEVGGVYSYQAIRAGTRLRSELRLRRHLADALASADQQWWKRLDGSCRLGRAKKDDYGDARLRVGVPGAAAAEARLAEAAGSRLTVWVTSDLLLSDAGQRAEPTAAALGRALSAGLGVPVEVATADEGLIAAEIRLRRLDSWHVGWMLPRPSLIGIAAGSCVTFDLPKGRPSVAALARVETEGLGERRAEGFGQVRLEEPLLTAAIATWEKAASSFGGEPPHQPALIQDADAAVVIMARIIERECWRREILRRALERGADSSVRYRFLGIGPAAPPISQLGGFRQVVARVSRPGDQVALGWLEHLKATPNRADKWPCGALDTVRRLLTEQDLIWQALNLQTLPTMTASGREVLLRELWQEALKAFVGGVESGTSACTGKRPDGSRPMSRRIAERYRVSGRLVALSPLHVGGLGDDAQTDLPLARDGLGELYVPGTSLTGVLRAWFEAVFDEAAAAHVFGSSTNEGHASFVVVGDGRVTLPNRTALEIRDNVGIDRVDGVAHARMKHDRAILPRGTSIGFALTCEAAEPGDRGAAQVAHLLRALQVGRLRVGAATSRGLGRIALRNLVIRRQDLLTRSGMLATLRNGGTQLKIADLAALNPDCIPSYRPRLAMSIIWRPEGPLMVKAGYDGNAADGLPLVTATSADRISLVLPGSSIKGALRSHAERIVRTVLGSNCPPMDARLGHIGQSDLPLIANLFGTAGRKEEPSDQEPAPGEIGLGRSALAVEDCFLAPSILREHWDAVEQANSAQAMLGALRKAGRESFALAYHSAVDRWTGGAADQLLFSALEPHLLPNAKAGAGWRPLRLTLDYSRLPGDLRAPATVLLLLVLRDLTEGWLPLGYGTQRGYGQLNVREIVARGEALEGNLQLLTNWRGRDPGALISSDFRSAWQFWIATTRQQRSAA